MKGYTLHIFTLLSVVFRGYEACKYQTGRYVEQNKLQAVWLPGVLPSRGRLCVEFGF
jgi:hypothetical protein